MKVKSYKHIIYFGAGAVATLVLYALFATSSYFEVVRLWAIQHQLALCVILFSIKAIGIIWPPIPGGFLTIGAIPFLGWWQVYLVDFAGSMAGSSVAYFISRKYGEKFLKKIFDEESLAQIRRFKVHKHRELEAIFVFRLFGGSIVELVCYGAGLLKISYRNFLLGSVLSHAAVGIPVFYFAQNLFSGKNFLFNVIFVLVVVSLFMFYKDRYFHLDEAP